MKKVRDDEESVLWSVPVIGIVLLVCVLFQVCVFKDRPLIQHGRQGSIVKTHQKQVYLPELNQSWLDKEKTSPYELFQYMRNVDDRDVEKFLLQLTFLPTAECKRLGAAKDASEINHAKEVLAFEVTKLIHGEEKAK